MSRFAVSPIAVLAAVAVAVVSLAPLPGRAQDRPSQVGKTITVDGNPMPTNGRIVTLDGNTVLFDGRPAIVDGKPLTVNGRDIAIDGKPVVQKGKWLGRQALLVFTVDTRWPGSSQYRIERDIASPLERALRTVPGVLDIHSTVVGNRTQTQLSFAPSTSTTATESTIRQRIDQIKFRLPHDASRPQVAWRRDAGEAAPSTLLQQ